MPLYYLDTSALVKLYVREAGSDEMLRLAALGGEHTLAILSLARVEFRSAVRARERQRDIPPELADKLIRELETHIRELYWVQPLTESVVEEAGALVDRHFLRAYDAIQLASCLALRVRVGAPPTFVCADRRLLDAAQQEGLATFDPTAVGG